MPLPPGQGAPVLPALIGGLAAALIACGPRASAAGVETLLTEPAPLVLKDGRIARVGVYAVTFPVGSAEPAPASLTALDTLIDAEATDCFLTAQAIGHAEPEAISSGDALAAHRLARARAERVQKEMVDRGLAATAIAGVWDWQFVVKQPRVTLWVFDLPEGSDCKGTPLARAHTVASAAAEPGPGPVVVSGGTAEEPESPRRPAPPGSSSTAAASLPDQPLKARQENPSTEAPEPLAAVEPPAPPTAPASSSATTPAADMQSATPAPDPTVATASSMPPAGEHATSSKDSPAAETVALGQPDGSVPSAPNAPASPPATDQASSAASDGETVSDAKADVLFDVNSSFLSKAAGQALQGLADRLRQGGRFVVELTASVGGEVRDASGQQADTYNHWMAERRIGRVTDWLRRNAGTATLEFKPDFVEESGAPRVSVRLEPTG